MKRKAFWWAREQDTGHHPFYADKNLLNLDMDTRRVARFVNKTQANAWVVLGGSREVLAWFAAQNTPAFALAGQRRKVPIAATGPDKAPALAEVTRLLIKKGHCRISLLARKRHRLPQPGRFARAFLGELEDAGITTGAFNLPDWEETHEGFEQVFNSLFESTPPTALILDESQFYHAAYHHLAGRGLRMPENISMICTEQDLSFAWC